jgi:hypothetical protein
MRCLKAERLAVRGKRRQKGWDRRTGSSDLRFMNFWKWATRDLAFESSYATRTDIHLGFLCSPFSCIRPQDAPPFNLKHRRSRQEIIAPHFVLIDRPEPSGRPTHQCICSMTGKEIGTHGLQSLFIRFIDLNRSNLLSHFQPSRWSLAIITI